MDAFTLDFSDYYEDILSAFKAVFGYKYSSIIDERMSNVLITTYSNYDGIKEYYEFLEDAMSKELCIKFLNKIGYDIEVDSYVDDFDEEIKKLINIYLDGDYAFKPTFQIFPDTFRAFNDDESTLCSKDTIINNRIKFINNILNKNITKDTYYEFIKTDEYKKFMKLIEKYNLIYISLCDEMNNYLESIKKYKKV